MPDSTPPLKTELHPGRLIGALGYPANPDETLLPLMQMFTRKLLTLPETEIEGILLEAASALSLADPYRAALATIAFAGCIDSGHRFPWMHRPLLTWLGGVLERCDRLLKAILAALPDSRPERALVRERVASFAPQYPLDVRAWQALDTVIVAFSSLLAKMPENRARVAAWGSLIDAIAPFNAGAFYLGLLTQVESEEEILVIDVPSGVGFTAKVSEIETNMHLTVLIEEAILEHFGPANSSVENLEASAAYAKAQNPAPGPDIVFQTRSHYFAWTALDKTYTLPDLDDYPRYFQHAIYHSDRPTKIPRWGRHRVILRRRAALVYVLLIRRHLLSLKPSLEVTQILTEAEVASFVKQMAFTNVMNAGVQGSFIAEQLHSVASDFWMANSVGLAAGAFPVAVKNLRRLIPLCQFHWEQLPREDLARMSALIYTLEQVARLSAIALDPKVRAEAGYLFGQVTSGRQGGLCGDVVLHIAEALFVLARLEDQSVMTCFTSQTFAFAKAAQSRGLDASAEVQSYFANILADMNAVREIGNPAFLDRMAATMWPALQPAWWPALPEYLMGFAYEVALSFAGDNRDVSRELAGLLRGQGCRVFFDEYEEASLWGKDLYAHLTSIYRDKALFCVVFLSKSYLSRLWTTVERQAAHERAIVEQHEYILPLKLDDSQLEGPLENIAYRDLRTTSLAEVAQFVVAKLRKRFSESGTEAAKATQTPPSDVPSPP